MAKTVNILGDSPKQQWLNAINLMEFAIESNVSTARNKVYGFGFDPDEGDEVFACLDGASNQVKLFADEMRRLVEGVFEEDE